MQRLGYFAFPSRRATERSNLGTVPASYFRLESQVSCQGEMGCKS
ncbi:hypothetical protein BH23VER1_BH23VER1_16470 [soil metagenome]